MADQTHGPSIKRKWSRVSLTAQGVGVMLVPMMVLVVAMLAIYLAEGRLHNTEQVVARTFGARSAIVRLQGSLFDASVALTEFLESGTGGTGRLEEAANNLQNSLHAYAALPDSSAEAVRASGDISRLGGEDIALLRETAANGYRGNSGRAGEVLARSKDLTIALQGRLLAVNAEADGLFNGARADSDLARQRLFTTIIACGILGPLLALFIHLLVAGRMVKRIQEVEENARRLAQGLPLQPFRPGTDEIASLAKQIQDTAVLLRARESELRESERRYRDLFESAPVPYEETDAQGVVQRFNGAICSLLKCAPDQVMGRNAWEFVDPDQQESVRAAMMERIATGTETGPFECDYLLDDGSRISVEVRERLIRSESGAITGTCRSLMDVTERNLAAMAARKVEQYAMELRNKNEQLGRALEAARSATMAKSRFLASVSHELRTPLNGIIGFSELMYDGRLGPISDDHKDCLADILTSARHLLQLINDILDLSKVEAGKMEFRPELVDVGKLVYEVRDVIRPLAERKNLTLAMDLAPDIEAFIDASRFKQVLYNYLSNAVKFTPKEGRVSVHMARENTRQFRVEVADTGIGISEEEVARLFQEFQQLPNSRKAEQGTGLGLALTRHIVEAQGGSVGVRSVLGQGSTFWAIMPFETILRG